MKKVGYINVTSKLYPNMRHEILNETEKQRVWDDILLKLEEWTKNKQNRGIETLIRVD